MTSTANLYGAVALAFFGFVLIVFAGMGGDTVLGLIMKSSKGDTEQIVR